MVAGSVLCFQSEVSGYCTTREFILYFVINEDPNLTIAHV